MNSQSALDNEQMPHALQAFQLVLATIYEIETRPYDEIDDRPGRKYFSRLSLGLNALSEMYGDARHVVTTSLDFSCVQTDADIYAQLTESISNRNRTLHGPSRPVEGSEHSIARSLDQVSAESRQLSINRPIMLFEAGRPSPITDRGHLFGRAHDVGEEHRGQKTITGGDLPRPGQEFLDLSTKVRRARPRDVVSRVEFYVAGTGDVLGKIAAVANPTEPVVTSVED
jgi:hypothetical protein